MGVIDDRLAGIVISSKLGNEIRGVLRRVHSQSLGDDQKGTGKLGYRQLFSGALKNFIERRKIFISITQEIIQV